MAPKPVKIPAALIEYFLLGKARGAPRRFTQDGGIVTDVWLAFAKDREKPRRVIVQPSERTYAAFLGHTLHRSIAEYRRTLTPPETRDPPSISPLENFVTLNLYFDELLRVVLPFTTWYNRKHLASLRQKAASSGSQLDTRLEKAILSKLGRKERLEAQAEIDKSDPFQRRVLEVASVAALIGVFKLADNHPEYITQLVGRRETDPALNESDGPLDESNRPLEEKVIGRWIDRYAEEIAVAAREELSMPSALPFQQTKASPLQARPVEDSQEPPELITRVFLDREATLADTLANCTVKADAAYRVFDVSCRDITWGIIDSGIATTHPAFLDHGFRDRRGQPVVPPPTRIRMTLDFTLIERIRNFDLIDAPDNSPERLTAIEAVVTELENLPGRKPKADFRKLATGFLADIARELDQRLLPSWTLIEPLIRLVDDDKDDGSALISDHGTHVAGILGADWRDPAHPDDPTLRGVCPDIGLYDLRVLRPDRSATEAAVVAALEFVQFKNARAGGTGPIIHGVNISMSIPHDVRNYACGATPVCVACDRLVNSGVVVVAAAGNQGWNEVSGQFGNFVFCSITDPGNAREVITVGSTHRLKPHLYGVSYFSSRGPTGDGRVKPDLVAPGEQVRGPVRGELDDELDGTSMAAPFVSGAAAMLIARNRELIGDPHRVKQILCDSATDLGREKYFQGCGLLDILRAMQSI